LGIQGCKDLRIQGCEDSRILGCEDSRILGCEDSRMGGCEELRNRGFQNLWLLEVKIHGSQEWEDSRIQGIQGTQGFKVSTLFVTDVPEE
jgi:hypothetical protein